MKTPLFSEPVKRLWLVAGLIPIALGASTAYAGSAVAVDKATGAYAYSYGKAEDAAKEEALKLCPGNCEILVSSGEAGYGGVMRNRNHFKKNPTETILVDAAAGLKEPAAYSFKSESCTDCFMVAWWNDAGGATGNGVGEVPVICDWDDATKIIDGRPFQHGFFVIDATTDPRMKNAKITGEYYYGFRSGRVEIFDNDIKVREDYYKDGAYAWEGYSLKIDFSGNIEAYTEVKNFEAEGRSITFNSSGQKLMETTMKDGKLDGPYTEYDYTTGTKITEGQFSNRKPHGKWTGYYPTGEKHWDGGYLNKNMHGPWKFYRKNGTVLWEGGFKNGRKHGHFVRYFDRKDVPEDTVAEEGNYVDGTARGTFRKGKLYKGEVTYEEKQR